MNMYFGDEIADPNRRTKASHPYSYDPITQFRVAGEPTSTIYTDRLLEWDFARHDELCQKHFGNKGQYWDRRSPAGIQAFLRDWCEKPDLKLIAVIEYCNLATGYPTWRLDYNA